MSILPFTRIDNSMLPAVGNGEAENIQQLFDKIIKPQFENVDTIIKIHKSILKYVNSLEPVFFVRLYGSYSRNNYHKQRRGFQTVYDNNIRVTFCDNTFTLLFTGMKLADIPYTSENLKNLFNQSKLIVGFGQVSEEKELCYYTPIGAKRVNLNAKGWYQAHIKPTGYGFDNLDIKKLFPNPPRTEYNKGNKLRKVEKELTTNQLRILKAHFLRLIHPFNSFLVPKRSHLEYNGNNIGEENELLNHVRSYIINKFPNEYSEFNKQSIEYEIRDTNKKTIKDIKWFDKPKNKRKIIKNKGEAIISSKLDNSIIPEVELDIDLEKTLRAIGKEVFALVLYPELSKNINIKYDEISEKYDSYKKYTINSQRSRLSKAKSIFRIGEEIEALINILESNKIKKEVKSQIKRYLNNNGS